MKRFLLAQLFILTLSAGPAVAQRAGEVARGDIALRVRATGTVVAEGRFRLKSTSGGRVEAVLAKTYGWYGHRDILGLMANKDLAALIDYRGATRSDILGKRWQKIYKPTSIRCPKLCYLTKVFIKPKQWVRPHAILFEAVKKLKLVGEVESRHASLIRFGHWLEFWPVGDPSRKLRERIANLVIDKDGTHAAFSMDFSRSRYLDLGTRWEGIIVPAKKRRALNVPTEAIIIHEGSAYIPVLVSTGVWTEELTEVLEGVSPGQKILISGPPRARNTLPLRRPVKKPARRAPEKKPSRIEPKARAELLGPEVPLEDPYAE